MDPSYPTGTGTAVAIHKHPLHPLLVPLPIGFLIGALIADVVFVYATDPFWARAAFWCIVAGIVTGAIAGLAGLVELLSIARARAMATAWFHGVGNVALLALAAINLAMRWNDYATPINPTGLVLSVVITAGLLVTGWLGGELSYRHGIGVSESVGVTDPASLDRRP